MTATPTDTNEWPGYCSICEGTVVFRSHGSWHRDQLVCTGCGSIPRQRALMSVLSIVRPDWRGTRIWELAPAGPASEKLSRGSDAYIGSHYWPDVTPGTMVDGVRCEDLERPTFADASIDIVVSSDVFEHIIDVDLALGQVERVLDDGGMHVWTTPQYRDLESSKSRVRRSDGRLEHLVSPEYHGDPVNPDGALVTFDWGRDLPSRVEAVTGMSTTVFRLESRLHGLLGEFLEVFVSYKGPIGAASPNGSVVWLALESQIASMQRALDASLETIASMESSRSWRLTKPLRAMTDTIRRRGR
jgi:hypothetical protein